MSDRIGSGTLILFALAMMVGSHSTGLGSIAHPGPGFLPFLTGVLLLIASSLVFVEAGKKGDERERGKVAPLSLKRPILTVVALGLSVALFSTLGFTLTVFLLMLSLFFITESKLGMKSFCMAILTALFTYLVFSKGFSVPFPKGFLGF